jgi:hypothetical protein
MTVPLGSKYWDPNTGHVIVLTPQGWATQNSPQMPISQGDQTGLDSLTQQTQQAQQLAQKANQFMQLQGRGQNAVATGPGYEPIHIPIPVIDGINLNPTRTLTDIFAPKLAAKLGDLDSVSNQAWTGMRPPGSGPMRMPEIEGFKQAFPNTDNFGQTNADVTDRLNQDAQIASQKLQFIDSFIKAGQGNYADANAAWQKSQQGNISMNSLPPPQGQNAYGQPLAAQTYNSGVQPTQGQVPPVSMSPAATPMQATQQPQQAPQQGFKILGVQ